MTEEKKLKKYQRKNKISPDLASEQVTLLNCFYDVDTDFVTEDMGKALGGHMLKLKKHICRGRLSVEDTDSGPIVEQLLEKPLKDLKKLKYGKPPANTDKVVDRYVEKGHTKAHALLAVLSGEDIDDIGKFDYMDAGTADDLAHYFLFL